MPQKAQELYFKINTVSTGSSYPIIYPRAFEILKILD